MIGKLLQDPDFHYIVVMTVALAAFVLIYLDSTRRGIFQTFSPESVEDMTFSFVICLGCLIFLVIYKLGRYLINR